MRCIGKFACEVLPCEVEIFMHFQPPPGTIGHIVDDAIMSDVLAGAAVASVTAQFHFCDDDFGGVHKGNYKGVCKKQKRQGALTCALSGWIVTLDIVIEH